MARDEPFNAVRFLRLLGCMLLLSSGMLLALMLAGGPYQLVGYGAAALAFILYVACSGSLSRPGHTDHISEVKTELERQQSRHLAILEKLKGARDGEQLAAIEQEIKASGASPAIHRSLKKMAEARRQMLQFDTLIERAESTTSEEEQARLLDDLEAFGRTLQRDKNRRCP